MTPNAGVNTTAAFTNATSSIAENGGPASIGITITNPDATNATNVTVTATGATGRIGSFTSPVVAAGGASSVNLSVPITDNLLCDGNQNVTFTITGVTGGQGTPGIGAQATHILTVNNDDVCTNVSFATASATVGEASGTYNVVVNITDFSASQATTADVVLVSGNGARINGYTTQTVTFPANDGTAQTVTLTVSNNGVCDGNEVLTFALQNIAGGQGTPTVGANRTLTITDDEVSAPPVATAATGVGSTSFTANWNAVSGATNYRLDVYEITGAPATDLIISEYVEGSSNNKYIEVYNGTGANVNLADYRLRTYSNGDGTPTGGDVQLSGTLNNGATIVYRNGAANIYAGASTVNGAVNFNGNDAVVLYKISTTSNVDIIGRIGENPGAAWTGAGGYTTLDRTLVRNADVGTGITTNPGSGFPTLTTEWALFGIDVVTNLGSHTYNGLSITYLPGYNNFDAGTSTSQLITGLASNSNYYYVVRATGGCAAAGNSNEISVLTAGLTDYYSQASGDVDDAIWSTTPIGTPDFAVWTSGINMNVQAGDVVTLTSSVTLGDVNVEGTLVLADGSSLTINGDELFVIGTLTAEDNSLVELFGEDVTVSVLGTPSFFNLTVNNSSIVLVEDPIAIRGTLFVEAGEFATTAVGGVIMQSDANGTGRLGPLFGATYTGDITMQRYIPAGATNWRLMGSPVAGKTINDWNDDFITAGFPGSNSPTFSNPVGSGILWPSVRWYDETKPFAAIDTGWVGVSSIGQSLAQGQGFAAWCGTGLTTTTAFTIDVTGAPYIAETPIDVPLSYTDNGAPSVDGWNAVSNPLPSPILFSNIDRTNVEPYVWYYDPSSGNTATYNMDLEEGTLGGTDVIQSSQAFLVKATTSGAQVQFEESDKVEERTGGFFGSQASAFNGVRLMLTSGLNTFKDEAVVLFSTGTPDLDGRDVPKLVFAHPDAPQLATLAPTGEKIAINAFGAYSSDITIPLVVDVAITGTYTVTASSMHNLGLTCLMLEDLQTGTMTPMTEGAGYSFTINANDDATAPRLVLHASAPVPMVAEDANCFGSADGQGTIVHVGDAPIDITWSTSTGAIILQQTIASGVAIADGLAAGNYSVNVSSSTACGTLVKDFTIAQPMPLEALADYAAATCPDTEDGSIDLTILGGTAPFTYLWSNGSTNEDLVALPGTYNTVVTDANGCVLITDNITLVAAEEPLASATADVTTTLVDLPVSFTNTSVGVEAFTWNFGDGTISDEMAPIHTWSTPGTFTVTLTVFVGDCSSTWSTDVVVETSTSITNATNSSALNAWFANDKFVVEHTFDNGQPVVIDVLDATGRLHTTRQAAGTPARINVPAERLSTGIWFLRITNNGTQRTLRVPLVR